MSDLQQAPLAHAIHIGFQKAASTWIQDVLTVRVPEIVPIGKPGGLGIECSELLSQLASCDDYDFDPEHFQRELRRIEAKNPAHFAKGRQRVISFEYFVGDFFTGVSGQQNLKRLRAVFGDVRIVLVIREQSGIIESVYRHYVGHGGELRIDEFLYHMSSRCNDDFGNQRMFTRFRYDRLVAQAYDLFGRENVTVIPFETLKIKGPREMARLYLNGVGLPEVPVPDGVETRMNEGLSYAGTRLVRIFNHLIPTPYADPLILRAVGFISYARLHHALWRPLNGWVARFSGKRRFVDHPTRWWLVRLGKALLGRANPATDNLTIAQDIRARYAESNRRTAELTGLDLAGLGYAV